MVNVQSLVNQPLSRIMMLVTSTSLGFDDSDEVKIEWHVSLSFSRKKQWYLHTQEAYRYSKLSCFRKNCPPNLIGHLRGSTEGIKKENF